MKIAAFSACRHVAKLALFSVLSLSTALSPIRYAYALDGSTLPSNGVVVSGNAQFDYAVPNELHIQQNTDKAVINWDSFNIGENALTQFHQNSSNSIAVNRVTGKGLDPTQILGTLKANGKVVVLDRNGVIFGQNSVVDVGGIVASTGNIDDTAFMANGQLKITGADTGGAIINNGHISVSDAGLAAFVSPTVKNNGIINARLGKVTLAAGDEATVDLYGDGLVELAAGKKLTNALIENTGTINAEGGIVTITASGAKDIVNTVINTSGIINVSSVSEQGGKIILEGANTEVSGTLDASGAKGGGTILIGGDYQGQGTVKTANKATITKTAKIKANATGANGNGGKVIVWADDTTRFDGKIEAKGGYVSGDGGFVETSGKINLGVSGEVDASAVNGLAGSWLLDPSNVIIVGTGGNNVTGGTNNPTTDSYQVSAASIQTALNAGSSVIITTTRGAGTQDGNITTNGTININKTTGGNSTLTLQAANNIELSDTTISSTGNRLGVTLTADSDANGSGAITMGNVSLTTRNGDINFNKPVTLTADNNWNAGTGVVTTGSTVDMGSHNLTITAGNMNIGGNMSGVGANILTIRPSTTSSDIGVNGGYNFVLDLTEANYLNPGSKLILGHANGTGYSNFIDWDLSGKSFDLELNNAFMWLENFKQGNGEVKINTNQITLYGLELGNKDFFIDAKKIGSNNGVIDLERDITKAVSGQSKLTLKSAGYIEGGNIISSNGALDVVIWGDADNTANDGAFNHQGTITTLGGDIYIVGGLDDGANGGVAGDGIGDGYSGAGSILWGANYNAGGGDILIQGQGGTSDHGFTFGNSTAITTSGTGNITVRGVAGNVNGSIGVNVGGQTQISAENGTIRIEGTNTRARTYGDGVFLGNSKVFTTGTVGGDIHVTGTRTGSTGTLAYGVELYSSNNEVTSVNGNIYITGTAATTTNGVTAVGIFSWGDTKIASQHGDITLTGTASGTTGTVRDWITDANNPFIIGDAAATGNITLNVNNFEFRNSQTSILTQGEINIKPRTANTSIGVSGGAGALNLSDAVLAYFHAGTLAIGDRVNGTGDVTVDTWDLSALGYNVDLYGNDINLNGLTLGSGNFSAYAKDDGVDVGDVSILTSITKSVVGHSVLDLHADNNVAFATGVNVTAITGSLDINAVSDTNYATVAGGNVTATNSTFTSNGGDINLTANGSSAVTLANTSLRPSTTGEVNLLAGGALSYVSPDSIIVDNVSGISVLLRTTAASKNITSRGQITASGAGDAAVLSATGNFINEYGANLFDMAGAGRWLVYSSSPALNIRNGLMPNAQAIYNATYVAVPPSGVAAGNRFLFSDMAANAPVVTVTADNATKSAGSANGAFTYTVGTTGLVDADTASEVHAGNPSFSTIVDGSTPEGVYTDALVISAGSLVSYLGYNFIFENGDFSVTSALPLPITVSPTQLQEFANPVAAMDRKMIVNNVSKANIQNPVSAMNLTLDIEYSYIPSTSAIIVDGDSIVIDSE